MSRILRVVFQIERLLAALCGLALVLTLLFPDWIERLFGASPDGGDGGAEWGVNLLLLGATLVFSLLARRHGQALRAAT
jgi:hypothetical protein